MESPNLHDAAGLKRKRSPGIAEERPSPGTVHPGTSMTQINYLVKARSERLGLIQGDTETFGEVLGMIDDYEGVLQRHESLAANLGAKLVGPLLLKSFEKLFDGPIKVNQSSFGLEQSPVTWLDIVTFARTNPSEFNLSESAPGVKSCRFWIKGGQAEISEDDFRLIMSGGPERMIPTQPIPEDESAELGTLNILEARLALLIKKADAVASKARQLNYHLKGRKTAVLSRKAAEQPPAMMAETAADPPSANPNGEIASMQQQLLEQFMANESKRQSIPPQPRTKVVRGTSESAGSHHTFNGAQEPDARRMSYPHTLSEGGTEGQYRVRMAAKIEKLARGDTIYPPCDRCRRLKFDCAKHLTACSACTKKHAKCSWKDIKEGELDYMPPMSNQQLNTENGYGDSAMDGNVDPGLRTLPGMSSGSTMPQSDNRVSPQIMDHSNADRRSDNLSSDHATLTQIASAAAAAGGR
ncbi:hypothetical protein G7Y89_g3565 [Cudoniella acicularis]|uniref:Zn(2)-C6 fungal-type domain-containing protein n=1 Tax=Cudoniella acicularis TaxID=354080 RepID=A0A8H4W5H0_9HELO|nr:hypothetical protein G7Y89_g3565 [Cudoniella acicularis]